MRAKMIKKMALLMAAVLLLSAAGCGGLFSSVKEKKTKEKVTIGLWGNELLEKYSQYLCNKFPDVEFTFVVTTNSLDYYRYRNDHGNLPDIMTVRRFSLRDAVQFKDKLYDLSNTKLASTYDSTYLDLYTYEDGTINWLPACAEVDSIIANKTLFEEYHIPIPTDYDSFIKACESFEAEGIRGFVSDYGSDYTCMETLQGFSVSRLFSMEGRTWRMKYESGATDQLSQDVWMPVFEKFFDMKEKTGLGEPETVMENRDPKKLYMQGKLAMYRGTGTDVINFPGREGDQSVLLPYFGDTAKDNWYLTYPAFQVAACSRGMEDSEREALILDIMTAMLEEEGQQNIAHGKNMIAYNQASLELMPELPNMKDYISDNKLYIRLASDEMFLISKEVVQKILRGEIDTPRKAFDLFNARMLQKKSQDPAVCHVDTAYSNAFTAEHGNPAASAIFNTIRREAGTDLLYAQSCLVSGQVYEGDYTEKEIGYLCKSDGGVGPVIANLTGDQLYQLVETTLQERNSQGAVCNDSTLYVSSGFEMKISRGEKGYTLEELTIDGTALDREKVYSVFILCDRDWVAPAVMKQLGCESYDTNVDSGSEYLKRRLVEEKGRLEAPIDYISIYKQEEH